MSLQIGNLVIPMISGFDIDQSYEPIGGESILRAMSGRGIKQMSYQKLKVTTSGSGWVPAGLNEIDVTVQQVLRCVVPRKVVADFSTRQATLPSARRSDAGFTPYGIALLASGQAVRATLSMVGSVATLEAVSGAVGYAVMYFPQLTVWVMRPADSMSLSTATHQWEIVCEEV